MNAEEPRPLTKAESASLGFMLSGDFPGVEQLREQAETALVMRRCVCGCPSIDIAVDRANTPPARHARPGVAAEARSRDERYTHLLLWVDGGYLDGLELSWLERPDEFPPTELFDPPERT